MRTTQSVENQQVDQSTTLLLGKAFKTAQKSVDIQDDVQDAQLIILFGSIVLSSVIDSFIESARNHSGYSVLWGIAAGFSVVLIDRGFNKVWHASCDQVQNKIDLAEAKSEATRLGLFAEPKHVTNAVVSSAPSRHAYN